MGVVGLWQSLSGVMEPCGLDQMKGLTLAVDLSAWICQARGAAAKHTSSIAFFVIRTIFYRTLEFLSHDIHLVFVLEGRPPDLKMATLQKRNARRGKAAGGVTVQSELVKKIVELVGGLGLPVVQSPGEAEKMCAYLNSAKLVDGVLTDDSDTLLFGARKVYRHYDFQDKAVTTASMDRVEQSLGFDQRTLVAFALLSGCDYNERGVKGMGPESISSLFKEMRGHCDDILDRICWWDKNEQMLQLSEVRAKMDKVKRGDHCTVCTHIGTKHAHCHKGCETCYTERGCTKLTGFTCPCEWHELVHQMAPFSLELKAREKALEIDNFIEHSKKIVREFTTLGGEKEAVAGKTLTARQPDIQAVCDVLYKYMRMDKNDVVAKLIPVFAHMQMNDSFSWSGFQPIKILKACKRNFVKSYQTVWSKIDADKWTSEAEYTVVIEQDVFHLKYPQLVLQFNSEKSGVPSTPQKQRTLSTMFASPTPTVTMVTRGEREGETTPTQSVHMTLPTAPKKRIIPKSEGSRSHSTSSPLSNGGMKAWKRRLQFGSPDSGQNSGDNHDNCDLSSPLNKSVESEKDVVALNYENMDDMGSSQNDEVVCQGGHGGGASKSSVEIDTHSCKSEDLFPSDDEIDNDTSLANCNDRKDKDDSHTVNGSNHEVTSSSATKEKNEKGSQSKISESHCDSVTSSQSMSNADIDSNSVSHPTSNNVSCEDVSDHVTSSISDCGSSRSVPASQTDSVIVVTDSDSDDTSGDVIMVGDDNISEHAKSNQQQSEFKRKSPKILNATRKKRRVNMDQKSPGQTMLTAYFGCKK